MMDQEIKGLTIDGRFFTNPELIEFCKEKIKSNTEPKWEADIYRFILDFLDDSDYILQKTSGTTGTSKTIRLPKQALLASAKNTISFFYLKEAQVAVLCLPIRYIAGKMMAVRAMVSGLNLILAEPSSTPDFSGINKIDFCAMVPMQAANLLKQGLWPPIGMLILGGAETSPELIEQLQPLDTEVFETYGMAETCSHVALKRLNGGQPENYFTALPGIKLALDERGCLVIDAPYLPEKIITNDCVELFAKNRFRWLGRIDNVINSGGLKIQPEILEKQIQGILKIPCAVIGEQDEVLGQKVVLVVESGKVTKPDGILKMLAAHFDKKMLPKSIKFVETLPRNKSFKIDREELKKLVLTRH